MIRVRIVISFNCLVIIFIEICCFSGIKVQRKKEKGKNNWIDGLMD